MQYDNPLLYDDNTADEINETPGAEVIGMPDAGAFGNLGEGLFDAIVARPAETVWNNVKEHIAAQFDAPDLYHKDVHGGVDMDQPEWGKALDHAVYSWASKPTPLSFPDPASTGWATQVLSEVGGTISKFALARVVGLGPVAMLQGEEDRQALNQKLIAKGVDKDTARRVSNEEGAQSSLLFGLTGLPMPKLIGGIASPVIRTIAKAGVGVGFMTGADELGGLTRGAILDAHGYHEQAEEMRHWDWGRVLADTIGGGLLGSLSGPRLSDEARAILNDGHFTAAQGVRHADTIYHESGPGIPVNDVSSAASGDALRSAMESVRAGRPVNVADVDNIFDSHFLAFQRKNLEEAEEALRGHEGVIKHYDEEISKVQKSIEAARRDGHTDIAEHLESEELPKLQRVRDDAERNADLWRDEIDQHHEDARSREDLRQHFRDRQLMDDGFEAQRRRSEEASQIERKQGDRVARNFTQDARRVMDEARKGSEEAWQASAAGEAVPQQRGKYTPPEMKSPEQDAIYSQVEELRARAEAAGDDYAVTQLREIVEQHGKDKTEAEAQMVAAMCSIGL